MLGGVRELIALQTPVTLSEWRKERCLSPDYDVASYYDYLEVLSVPNHDYVLDEVIVYNVLQWLPSYALRSARCVSKLWSITHCGNTSLLQCVNYEQDAAREMSWYHLSKVKVNDKVLRCAAVRGYEPILPGLRRLSSADLCLNIASSKCCTERHLSLFRTNMKPYLDDSRKRDIAAECIINDRYQLFRVTYEGYTYAEPLGVRMYVTMAMYGRTKFLDYALALKNAPSGSQFMLGCVIASYFEGNYDAMNDYFSRYNGYVSVTYNEILEYVCRSYCCEEVENLDQVTYLFEHSTIKLEDFPLAAELNYTIDEFIRFWAVAKDRFFVTNGQLNVISYMLVVGKHNDVVLHLFREGELCGINMNELYEAVEECTDDTDEGSTIPDQLQWIKNNLML